MSDNHFKAEQLSQYIEGELPEAQAEQLTRHLKQCALCQGQLESLRRMLVTLGRLPDLAPSPGFLARLEEKMESRRSAWRRLGDWLSLGFLPFPARAAAAVIVAALAIGVVWHGERRPTRELAQSGYQLAKDNRMLSAPQAPATLSPLSERAREKVQEVPAEALGRRVKGISQKQEAEGISLGSNLRFRGDERRMGMEMRGRLTLGPPASEAKDGDTLGDVVADREAGVKMQKPSMPSPADERLQALGYLVPEGVEIDKIPAAEAPPAAESRTGLETDLTGGRVAYFGWPVSDLPASGPAATEAAGVERWFFDAGEAGSSSAATPVLARSNRANVENSIDLFSDDKAMQVAYGFAGAAAGTSALGLEERGPLRLFLSSSEPQETARALESLLDQKGWISTQTAQQVPDGTTVELVAWIPVDQIDEATQTILAHAETHPMTLGRRFIESRQYGDFFIAGGSAGFYREPIAAGLPARGAPVQTSREMAKSLERPAPAEQAEIPQPTATPVTLRQVLIRISTESAPGK